MLKAVCLLLVCVCAQAAIDKENFAANKKYIGPHRNGLIQSDAIQEHSNIHERHRRRSMPDRFFRVSTCLRQPEKIIMIPGDVIDFTSPGYPAPYTSRSNCGWKFKTSPGNGNITVTCSEFSLQPLRSGKCPDWLALGKERFCGNNGPSSVNLGRRMKLTFRSNRKNNFPGFSCTASLDPLPPVVTPSPPVVTPAPPVVTPAPPVVTPAPPVVTPAPPVVTPTPPVATPSPPVVTPAPPPPCVCGVANRAIRIVGGVETEVNEYPWQVALVREGDSVLYCGGSLINDQWVLTAAHCTDPVQVLLGNHHLLETDAAELRVDVKRVIDHPAYWNIDKDFSLVELATPLDLDALAPHIRPICLPSGSNPEQYDGVPAIVSGWGTTSLGGPQPDALQEVTVNTISNAECNEDYNLTSGVITSSMICALSPGKDACRGDSGGPLVTNVGSYFNLIGVVSWGVDCADPNYPGVYSRVTSVIHWIGAYTSSGLSCPPPS